MRQTFTRQYDPQRGVLIATLSYEYPANFRVYEHAHGSNQLIYAIEGIMEVSSRESVWLIPPYFAVWIPARTAHSIRMLGAVSMRTLYMRPRLGEGLPKNCMVLHVTPLLRELVLETVRMKQLRIRNRLHGALCELLLSQLRSALPMPISVSLLKDARARALAEQVIGNLAERRSLAQMCRSAGASVRTIERLFRRDVGSSFEFWRRQVRLMKAVELLVGGYSVKQTSFALGYRQPTAFVTMFRGILGTTPMAWVQALQSVS